jgi:MFS transporter, DHA1 family, multidrug resistance protein
VAEALADPTGIVHRHSLRAVFAATFFVRFAFGITLAVFASYILGRLANLSGGDEGTVGLVSAMAPIGEFSTVLLSGIATDRVGRFPVLFAGMSVAAVLFGLVSLTRSILALGALNFFFGIASGAILASSLTVIADRSTQDERGLEMGRFDAMNLAGWLGGFAFGIAVLGLVQDHHLSIGSLPYVFVLGSLTLVAGLTLAWYLARVVPRPRPVQGFPIVQILRNAFRRSVLLVTLPWLVVYMLIGYVLVFVGTASAGVGFPDLYLALGIGGGGFVLVLTQPRFGRLADRYGRTRLMNVGVAGFVGVMVSASLLVALGPLPELLAALALSAIAALAYGPAALAALADLSYALSRGTTMAIYSLTISLGMILGLVVGTQLVAHYGNNGYYVFFGGIAVALVALTLLRYRDVRSTAPAVTTIPAQ